ncbi:alpha/beta hydrolase [Pandoraea captiosa]|uniref:Alpha/beta hydrolase n=1 Tax=Pandoraea captiosa TaxID=2508302 RepID=A0A5E4ZF63_9BURK|nr:alpha/beta fold hydrolase [Pandoraea captiosa]VVE59939.1 alpha/beta hydrolase [Pandoraea captiosa]
MLQSVSHARDSFHVGSSAHPMYVERWGASSGASAHPPVVLIHGGGHTGSCYRHTPDGRPGWASLFVQHGYTAYVIDWPGHGRSPSLADFASLSMHAVIASLVDLLDQIGPATLVAHSAGGTIAWAVADQRPDSVCAILGIAPGPPGNLLPALPSDPVEFEALAAREDLGHPVYHPETAPVYFTSEFIRRYWANSKHFPVEAIEAYEKTIVPESPRILNERFNIGGCSPRVSSPERIRRIRSLVVTGSDDPRHPRSIDEAVAQYVGATHLWLPDIGIEGNGHSLMIERNSSEIFDAIHQWLAADENRPVRKEA